MAASLALSLGIGLVMFVTGGIFHLVTPLIFPSLEPEYTNTALFRPWDGWTRYYMIAHPFAFGLIFTFVYIWLDRSQVSAPLFRGAIGGLTYGFLVFLVGSLPVFLLAFASFQVSAKVVVAWIVQNFVQYLAAGAVLGWLYWLSLEKSSVIVEGLRE